MIGSLIARVVATSLGRWILGGAVALLLSAGAWKWHAFKEDLIHKGQQVCVQEINKATVDVLEQRLAQKDAALAEMRAIHADALVVAEERKQRELEAMFRLEELEDQMEKQKNEDPEYREWSATPLPDGVADRLRNLRTGSNTNPGDADGN